MFNKKTNWLGLVALLTIMPILVADPPPRPGADRAMPATLPNLGEPLQGTLLGPANAPMNTAAHETVGIAPSPGSAPFLPRPPVDPYSRILLAGQQPPTEEKKEPVQPEPAPAPAPAASPIPSFLRLPSVAQASTDTAPSPVPERTISGQSAVPSTGVGDLLANSNGAQGVEVQKRSPLVGDPRVEGLHFGQLITYADGGYYFPARVDLDSVVSKLNASDLKSIRIVKGPFSVRYGPGFSFLDIESIGTPRSTTGGFDAHGSSSLSYRTNSHGFQGQQSIWGGNRDWGFRLTYDANAAGNYVSGSGAELPSSYNNQFVNFAYGIDLTQKSSLEVKYLHVQQTSVLIPGLLTDINQLNTDAFSARYAATDGPWYDRITLDAWVNSTAFNGDSANPQTRAQIPQLDNIFPGSFPGFGAVRLDIATSGYALSYGAREITTWGDPKGFNVSLGADIRVFSGNYNEFDAFNLSVFTPPGTAPSNTALPANLGIPAGRQIDPGLLLDSTIPVGDAWLFKVGTRVDFTTTQFLGFGPNTDIAAYNQVVGDPQGDRSYFLFSAFATGEYKITEKWTVQAGYGHSQRPPTLTELYAGGAFLGLIQNGLNSIYGNPGLRKEEMHQINVGLNGKYDAVRLGGNAFYAFLPNYITYQPLGPFTVTSPIGTGITPIQQLQFINTPLATLYGFDAYGEADVLPWLTPFATLSFVEGWDQSRDQPLPGIAPFSSRVGLRFREPGDNPKYGMEYFARMVATQNLFASFLGEQRTGGFVVHNLRAYWQARDNFLVLAGVENIGNLQYREHLDLRTGSGVFQPGVNFYVGMKVNY